MRARGAQANAAITQQQLKGQLLAFLYQCRPSALAALTLEDAQRRYSRLPGRVVEYELTVAKQKRAEELASL